MDEPLSRRIALADEVKRRLRLDRFPKIGVIVGPHDGDEFDLLVIVPDPELATHVEELCGDLRVKISHGTWHRA